MASEDVAQAELRVGRWIQGIKAATDGKHDADVRIDGESLARAADLELIYQAMAWVEDMPAPKKPRGRGRRVDPKSREQFAKWVRQSWEWGSQQHLARLHSAHEFSHTLGVGIQPTGERSLRPLWRLRDQGYGEHLARVWQNACKLAGGTPPTSTETSRAVREFIEAHKPQRNVATDDRTAAEIRAARRARLVAEFDALLDEENRTAKEVLNTMIQHFNEHQQQMKAS